MEHKDDVFHPVSISLTYGETTREYDFIFKALVEAKDMKYKPAFLLGDASEAITNGIQQAIQSEFMSFRTCLNQKI